MPVISLRHPPPVTRGICAGRSDFAVLDPHLYVASVLAHADIASVGYIYSSPAMRCLNLARLIAAKLSLPFSVDTRLQELDFGEWEGQSWASIESVDRTRFRVWANDWRQATPPNGESLSDLERRVAQFVGDIRQKPALIVTHAGPIRAMRVICESTDWNEAMSKAVPYATPIRISHEGV